MKQLLVAVVVSLGFVFQATAQDQVAQAGKTDSSPAQSEVQGPIPNVLGTYDGSFLNKNTRITWMPMRVVIQSQAPDGTITGAVYQYVGTCNRELQPMEGKVGQGGVVDMKVSGRCPKTLKVRVVDGNMTGDMDGAYPFEVSLRK